MKSTGSQVTSAQSDNGSPTNATVPWLQSTNTNIPRARGAHARASYIWVGASPVSNEPPGPADAGPRYSKRLSGAALEYLGPNVVVGAESSLDLQVSLGDMDLEDAFLITVPPELRRLPLGDLLRDVFPEDEALQAETLAALDGGANPDLPDLYQELLDIFDQWRGGHCTLRFFANHGPQLELYQPVAQHLSQRLSFDLDRAEMGHPLLDLVIEQSYDVLAWFAEAGGDKAELMDWLRGSTLLYFIDKHRYQFGADSSEVLDRRLLPIACKLEADGFIDPNEESRSYEIADQGRQLLGQVIAETESYIDRFDVFSDVAHDPETQSIEFGTGRGEDLRVQVYESEGLDPIRVVFLLRLYDSTLDSYANAWREDVHREAFFDEILRPVLDHPRVDEELLEWIIESGYAHNEEAAEEDRERAFREEALRRVRRPEA